MQNIDKILVVIDPTVSDQPALRRAAWLGKNLGAELELLICYYNEYISGDRMFDSPSLEKARDEVMISYFRRLEEIAEPYRRNGLTVKASAISDHPLHEGIVRHTMANGANMVFKDTHHHSAIARVLLTNTDWNLIRTCPVPLWLVKPNRFARSPKIIGAIDPMNLHDKPAILDDEILRTGKLLADKVGGEVHAFHSYDPRVAVSAASANAYIPVSLPMDVVEQQMREKHQARLDALTGGFQIAADNVHLVSGLVHEELPTLVKNLNADVVVMGAIARNRMKRIFIGATAERTLENLPCDLLIIKPDSFRAPVSDANYEAT